LAPPVWLRVPILLAISVLAVRLWAKVSFSDIGFLSWRNWSTTEKLYFAQVVILANAIFIVVYSQPLGFLQGRFDVWPAVAAIFVVEFIWGFYQEFNYRGILQTELTRRFGGVWGPLTANVVFTLGPLHFYHLNDILVFDGDNPRRDLQYRSAVCLYLLPNSQHLACWRLSQHWQAYMNGAAEIALLSP
jgi:membrane protease YdiL (CAAX protease family)